MKVLIHRYNSICEPNYIRAFETLGLEVIEDREEMTRKEIPGDERVKTMAELILTNRPLFVFTINFFPYISEICERLRVFYVAVSADCPVEEIYDPAIRNSFNRVFLFDYAQYLSVCDENPDGVFYMPLGVDVQEIEEEIGRFEDFMKDPVYEYDISFVGSLYNEPNRHERDRLTSGDRISMLNTLAGSLPEYGVHLFTRSDTSPLCDVNIHGGVKTHAEMPTVFRRSRININTTMREIKTGMPQRIFDVLGSGGFLLSNAQEEIPEYFTPGKHLDIWENEAELVEKTSYWLRHEDERREVALAGYREVAERHTILIRVMMIVKSIRGRQ